MFYGPWKKSLKSTLCFGGYFCWKKKKPMSSLLTVNMNTNRLKGKIIFLSPVWGYFQGYVLPNSNSKVGKFHPWKKRRGIGSFTTDFPTSGNFPFDIDPTTISKTMYSRQVIGGIVGISDEDLVGDYPCFHLKIKWEIYHYYWSSCHLFASFIVSLWGQDFQLFNRTIYTLKMRSLSSLMGITFIL